MYSHHPKRRGRKSGSWLTFINIFFVACLVFLVFFEIALGNLISKKDAIAVSDIQHALDITNDSIRHRTTALYFFYIFCNIFEPWVFFMISIFIFLSFDPVLGFQFANAMYFLFYFMSVLQLFYSEPHAYWKYSQIHGVYCPKKYAEPSTIVMGCFVAWSYFIFMFFFRYQACSKPAKIVIIIIAVIVNLVAAFGMVIMGLHLFIHIIVSWVWGCIYLLLLIKFDAPFHDFMTKTGFILKKTKRKVFVVFFVCLGFFALSIIIFHCVEVLTEP